MATAVFVFRQIICLLFLTAWLVMFCFDNFFDQGDVLIPFWFNCIAVGVLAFSLGINVESLTAFKGFQVMPAGQSVIPPTTEYVPPPQQPGHAPQQPARSQPYVPPEARR